MEVRVRERLIGALVLVAIVVLLVPAVLKGRAPAPAEPPPAQSRRVEMPVGNEALVADEAVTLPEPALPAMVPPGDAPPAAAPSAPPVESAAAPKPAAPAGVSANPVPKRVADPPAPRPVPAASGSAWAVQLGAFSSRDKADQFVSALKKRGYAAFVLEYRASGKVLYRVRVGPEQERSRAEAIAARLAKEGYQPVVARHP
jgi:DedD protein